MHDDDFDDYVDFVVTAAIKEYRASRKTISPREKAASEAIQGGMRKYFLELNAPNGNHLEGFLKWCSN